MRKISFGAAFRVELFILVMILAHARTAAAGVWTAGQEITNIQAEWVDDPTASTLLTDSYDAVYASTFDELTIGWPGGFHVIFTDVSYVLNFFPQLGAPAALSSNHDNPLTTEAGSFGGDVLALQLNVDLSDAGYLTGTSSVNFGDLILANFTDKTDLGSGPLPLAMLNGLTVRDFLADVNTALGGGPSLGGLNAGDLDLITADLDASFGGGQPNQFAQDHLVPSVPEPSSYLLLAAGLLTLTAARRWRRPLYTVT